MTRKSKREIERAVNDLAPAPRDDDELRTVVIRDHVVGTDADSGGEIPTGEERLTAETRFEEQPDGSWTSERKTYDVDGRGESG